MLQILLAPVRWLFKLVVFLVLAILLLIWLIPAAFDIPARAAVAIQRINAARQAGIQISAMPASVEGFPPRLILNDLELSATGADRPALVAEETVVRVDAAESLSRGEVVIRADILQPRIAASQPFSMASLNAALTSALGVTTMVGIVGGSIMGAAGEKLIDLGQVVTVVPPIAVMPGAAAPGSRHFPGTSAGPAPAPAPGGTGPVTPGFGPQVGTAPPAQPAMPAGGQPMPPVSGRPGLVDWVRDMVGAQPSAPTPAPVQTGPGTPPAGSTAPSAPSAPRPIGQTPVPVPDQPGMCYCACPC